MATRIGIDPLALSLLESGKMLNPTLGTLHKWAGRLTEPRVDRRFPAEGASTDNGPDDRLTIMSETVLTIEDAACCLPDLVERIHANGGAALLLRSGLPVARIVPVPTAPPLAESLIAFLRRWRVENPEPDEQFAEAIAESRSAVQPSHDPWE